MAKFVHVKLTIGNILDAHELVRRQMVVGIAFSALIFVDSESLAIFNGNARLAIICKEVFILALDTFVIRMLIAVGNILVASQTVECEVEAVVAELAGFGKLIEVDTALVVNTRLQIIRQRIAGIAVVADWAFLVSAVGNNEATAETILIENVAALAFTAEFVGMVGTAGNVCHA